MPAATISQSRLDIAHSAMQTAMFELINAERANQSATDAVTAANHTLSIASGELADKRKSFSRAQEAWENVLRNG